MSFLQRVRLAITILRHRESTHAPVFVHPVGPMRRVERVEFLLSLARGHRVLHIGFLDSPFLEERLRDRTMLHLRLQDVSTDLFGIDVDPQDLARYRQLTGDTANLCLDLSRPDVDLRPIQAVPGDYIFLTEVLEHIGDPAMVLRNLHQVCVTRGARLVITVPNAFALHGFISATFGTELVHPDHFFYFSPVTLRRLVTSCGFTVQEMLLYGGAGSRRPPGLADAGIVCVCAP